MKFSLDKKEQYTVFTVLEEKLNAVKAPDLKTELALLSNKGINNIILNLEEVIFVDSSGLSAILVGNRLCSSNNGRLILCKLHNNVERLIKISQLDSILQIAPTVSEARDLIMMDALLRELQGESENETDEEEIDESIH